MEEEWRGDMELRGGIFEGSINHNILRGRSQNSEGGRPSTRRTPTVD